MCNNAIIKEQLVHYDKDVSEMDLLSILIGEKSANSLIDRNILYLKDIDEMTNGELLKCPYIGLETLYKIRALMKIIKSNSLLDNSIKTKISSPKDLVPLGRDLKHCKQEIMRVIFLNTKNIIIGQSDVFKGGLKTSVAHPREIFKEAVKRSCCSIAIIHNHPSGDPSPSPEDINITKRIKECGVLMGIELLDHVIIGQDSSLSFKEKGLL